MTTTSLGETEFDEYELKQLPAGADRVVYHYRYKCYEGSGYAAYRLDGVWHGSVIGHCSCNGPTDFSASWPVVTEEEMRVAIEDAMTTEPERAVFREILKGGSRCEPNPPTNR